MPLRFNIRDLLWLNVVVGTGLGLVGGSSRINC